jgi:hypothetical protein
MKNLYELKNTLDLLIYVHAHTRELEPKEDPG